jgi:hypothetical protein
MLFVFLEKEVFSVYNNNIMNYSIANQSKNFDLSSDNLNHFIDNEDSVDDFCIKTNLEIFENYKFEIIILNNSEISINSFDIWQPPEIA